MICYLIFLFIIIPINLFAAESTNSSVSAFGGGAFWIGLLCFIRRKKPIGGWLLYYFIGLYAGLIISIIMFIPLFPDYNPAQWDNKLHYFLFILTTVPGQIFIIFQAYLSFFLISKNRRDWKHIEALKTVLLIDFIISILSIIIDYNFWPDNVFLSVYSAALSLIWFLYFKQSVRVQYVFKDKNWNWELLHPKKYS